MPTAPHVVVFSELSPRARAQYTRFLLEQNVQVVSFSSDPLAKILTLYNQFAKRPSDGNYIAHVRLQPSLPPSKGGAQRAVVSTDAPVASSLQRQEQRRACTTDRDDGDDATTEQSLGTDDEEEEEEGAVPLRFQPFEAFVHKIGGRTLQRTSVGTYVASETKLVRLIDDMYESCAETLSSDLRSPFAAFVAAYLKGRFGIRALVEQQALELLEGLVAHKARLDVERFCMFLSGQYDATALAFFIKARDAVRDAIAATTALFRPTSAASARRRRSEASSTPRRQRRASNCKASLLWLSKSQIETAAQKAFGSKDADGYLQFAHRTRSFLATREAERPLHALLEVQEFLSLALHTFVESERAPVAHRSVSLSSASGHEAHDGEETVRTSSPSPSPLPPPPVPRAYGNTVRTAIGSNAPAVGPSDQRFPIDRPALVQPYPGMGGRSVPSNVAPSDDFQARLQSLMARMEQRRSMQ